MIKSTINREIFLRNGRIPTLRFLIDVAYADLDESSVGRRTERLLSIASPASEFSTTSTPSPSGQFQYLVGEGKAARVHDMRHSKRGKQIPFLGRAGGSETQWLLPSRPIAWLPVRLRRWRNESAPVLPAASVRGCSEINAVTKAIGIVAACSMLRWGGLTRMQTADRR